MNNKTCYNLELKNLREIAERESWVFTLDKDEGALFYSPEKITDNSELHQVTDETAVYLDKAGNLGGVVIEYYASNFLEHHKGFKAFDDIFDKDKDEVVVDPWEKDTPDEVVAFKSLLEFTVTDEAQKNLVHDK